MDIYSVVITLGILFSYFRNQKAQLKSCPNKAKLFPKHLWQGYIDSYRQ